MLALYILLAGKYKLLKEPALISGIIIAFLILGWWHWLAFSHYGEGFIKDYVVKHLLTRTTKGVEGHTGDILTYIGVVPNKGRPWAGIGLALLPYLIWRIFRRGEKEHLLPAIWAGTVLIIFSAVKTKLHWYMIPIYPALSVMTGWGASKLFKKYTVPVVSVLAFISLSYLFIDKGIFDLDYSPGMKQAATIARGKLPEGKNLFMYDISDPGLQFYLGDIGENIRKKEDLESLLKKRGNYIFVNKRSIKAFSGSHYSVLFENVDFALVKTGG
jgi:hypothetical protein